MAKNTSPKPTVIAPPPALRAGGVLIVLAVTFYLMYIFHTVTKGLLTPFVVNVSFLFILAAAGVWGYFAIGWEPRDRRRLIGLTVAVLLVIVGQLIPDFALMTMGSFWLPAYGTASLIAGLLLRRQVLTQALEAQNKKKR